MDEEARRMTTIFELGYWQFCFWWILLLAFGSWVWVWCADEKYKLWHDKRLRWWLFHWFTGGELITDKAMPRVDALDTYLIQRACLGAARASIPAGFLATIYVITHNFQVTAGEVAAWGYGGAVGLAAATWLVVAAACRAALSKWWARPLFDVVGPLVGWDEDTKPRQALVFDRIYELGLALTIYCHPSEVFAGQAGQTKLTTIDDAVGRKLGRDVERVEDFVGEASMLHYAKRSTIPDKVPFASVRDLIERAPESKILLGIAAGDEPFWLNFDSDSPHFLISAGTGGGKTSMQRSVGAQCLYKGHEVYVFDPKHLSHIWTRGRANVTVVSEPAAMHALFLELAGTLEDRKRETDGLTYKDPIPTWQRQVVILEELSVAVADLRAWWQSPAGGSHKGEPPSIAALRKILNQGRFLMINIVAGANRFDANKTGGGDARDQYAWVGLAEHSKHVVEMLAKGAPVEPKTKEDRKGRMQIVNGFDVTEIRGVWWEDNEKKPTRAKQTELEAWIRWLDEAHPPGLTAAPSYGLVGGLRPPSFSLDPSQSVPPAGRLAFGEPPLASVSTLFPGVEQVNSVAGDSLVTLRGLIDEGLEIGNKNPLKALRFASTRPGFPDPRVYRDGNDGHLYDRQEVIDYVESRPRARQNRRDYRPQVYAIVGGGWDEVKPGGQVKIGFSTWVPRRVRQLAGRMEHVVKVFDVEPPKPNEELPDKAWHRRFRDSAIDPDDPTSELFRLDADTIAWLNDPEDTTP
jgi:hypothetical protein